LKPEAKVFGVLQPDHAPKKMKTMTADLHSAEEIASHTQTPRSNKKILSWWPFKKKAKSQTPKEDIQLPAAPARVAEVSVAQPHIVGHAKVIDVPSEQDHEKKSPYRGRFMRQISKKWYLGSKLAIELPLHAKIGVGVAVLLLLIVPPVISLMSSKTPPKTAGAIVAVGTEALVAQVGKSIALPEGETPLVAIATADDVRRLNVTDAKPGNKILVYQKSGKIVVYDAETDKVLGVVNRAQP
jgi:hypothetical protein